MTDRELFEKIEKEACNRWFSKLKVKSKSKSTFFKIINWFSNLLALEENKDDVMKRFWTTFIYTILHPIQYATGKLYQWWTLVHELVHFHQIKRWTVPLFYYLYAWPCSQGGIVIATCWLPVFWASGWHLAVWIPGWALLGGLHFIPQLPDPWRSHWEYQAYCVSMKTYFDKKGSIPDHYVQYLLKLFFDMSYFRMETDTKRNRERMLKKLKAARIAILIGKVPKSADPYYSKVIDFYKETRDL